MTEKIGAIMTVGGGIGGVQASLDLAESGFKVYLVEEKAGIGGVMAQLDKTFPTNDCSACIFSPKLVTVGQNPNIEILAYSQVEGIEGEPGDFRVKVRKARFVDPDKCTSCGTCAEKCPTKVPNQYNFGHDVRKAIYKDYAQGIPSVYTIDTEHCRVFLGKKCGVCQKVCPAGAVDYEQKDVMEDVQVGAVILSPGFELLNTADVSEFGHGRMPNVVTNVEMERIFERIRSVWGRGETSFRQQAPAKGCVDTVCCIKGSQQRHATLQLCLLHGVDQRSRYCQRARLFCRAYDLFHGHPSVR